MIQLRKHPRYFHLLWDEDLDELAEVLKAIRDRRSEVVDAWYQLYQLHFGDERSLTETEFRQIFEPALLRNQEALLRKDMDGYAASVLLTGKRLAELQVPLDELIAAVQLFEEAAQTVFPHDPPPATEVFNKFDKLSHIRIILLISAYLRLQSAAAATRIQALEVEARSLPPHERTRFHGLIGRSPAMRELYRQIEAAAHEASPLLIVGESGTGKKLAARAVHECGTGTGQPFVIVRCAALPSYLIESELFGYSRDGGQTLIGLYGAAEGGTLLLDEVAAMPPAVQERLAATIQFAPNRGRAVRVIASLSRETPQLADRGGLVRQLEAQFAHVLRIPALRERHGDIGLLARHFIDLMTLTKMSGNPIRDIDEAALELMERYAWPGNVRELFETIESMFAVCASTVIGAADLPPAISGNNGKRRPLPTISFETFADAERAVLQRALEMTGGNKLRAAKLLKISRKKLYSGIAKYGLHRAFRPPSETAG
jgi:DNA-binding NtrC family response regulator